MMIAKWRIGQWRHDVLYVAAEDIPEVGLLLRRVRRPKAGVKLVRKRSQPVFGSSASTAQQGELVWVRTGSADVKACW